jgi:cysteinyl-tRNA synthetase
VLDIVPDRESADSAFEAWIEELLALRREARIRRDFAESDRIRDELKGRGVVIEDAGGESRWKLA